MRGLRSNGVLSLVLRSDPGTPLGRHRPITVCTGHRQLNGSAGTLGRGQRGRIASTYIMLYVERDPHPPDVPMHK